MYIDRLTISESHSKEWPFNIAPVQQIAEAGLTFSSPVTFFAGENGVGKSTLLEAIAEACRIDVRGGHGGRRYNNAPPRGDIGQRMHIQGSLARSPRKASATFFLRAETALGVFQFMSDNGVPGYGDNHLGRVSHGEGFMQVMQARLCKPGLWLLDEPEAALSFSSCMELLAILHSAAQTGTQVICATHSPLLLALPGAKILKLSPTGIVQAKWMDLELVRNWRGFMEAPSSYLSILLDRPA